MASKCFDGEPFLYTVADDEPPYTRLRAAPPLSYILGLGDKARFWELAGVFAENTRRGKLGIPSIWD